MLWSVRSMTVFYSLILYGMEAFFALPTPREAYQPVTHTLGNLKFGTFCSPGKASAKIEVSPMIESPGDMKNCWTSQRPLVIERRINGDLAECFPAQMSRNFNVQKGKSVTERGLKCLYPENFHNEYIWQFWSQSARRFRERRGNRKKLTDRRTNGWTEFWLVKR